MLLAFALTTLIGGVDLKSLYDGHHWFELRDAVTAASPALYRGAVACAFNEAADCDRILATLIHADPKSDEAAEARGLLVYRYQRAGRYREALAAVDALLEEEPGNASLQAARVFFGALARYPDQSVAAQAPSTIGYRMKGGNLFVPITVGSHTGSYIVDTGANFSLMSESEARRLGLQIFDDGASVTDATGRSSGARTTVVDEIRVGATRIRNVVFLVARDDQQPFVDLDPDERGVLGLPVLLAFESFRWTADGAFQTALTGGDRDRSAANLCFDGGMPATAARFADRAIELHLDTGARTTHLWPRFARDFASILSERGTRGTKRVTGVAHSVEAAAIVVPDLTIAIGGHDTSLRPAYVLTDTTDAAGDRSHGNLGMDLLRQSHSVTVDFHAMRLVVQ